MSTSVLVTGITGYLGSNVARRLVSEGFQVHGVVRSHSSLDRITDIEKRITLHAVEQVATPDYLRARVKPEIILNAATKYARGQVSVPEIVEANLVFPIALLHAAIGMSSEFTFLNCDTALPKELDAYALSKAQFREWGRFVAKQNSFSFVNCTVQQIFGPFDDDSKFPTMLIRACLAHKSEIFLTSGEQSRDFIYITDAIEALLLLIRHRRRLAAQFVEVEVGSGKAVKIKDFAQRVKEITCSPTSLQFGAVPTRSGEPLLCKADTSSLEKLGWSCQYDYERGIQEVVRQELQK